MNATLSVVENKLTPIAKAVSVPTTQVTAQYLTAQFDDFTASHAVAGYSMRDIYATTVRTILQAEVKEVELACTGLIQSTRKVDASGAQIAGKEGEGERTAAARKFASWLKSLYGAVRFAGLSVEEFDAYPSADSLYAASVKYRKEAGDLSWHGVDGETKAIGKAKKATAKAVAEVLEETGGDVVDLLTMDTETFKAVKAAADVKLKEKAAADKLAAMEAKADKLAKALVKEFASIDDALAILDRARAQIELIAVGAV